MEEGVRGRRREVGGGGGRRQPRLLCDQLPDRLPFGGEPLLVTVDLLDGHCPSWKT